MSIASVLFMVVGILAVAFSIVRGIGVEMLINVDAFVIVIGGSIVALFLGHPIKRIKTMVSDVLDSFKKRDDRESLLEEILFLANVHRKDGIRALEKTVKSVKDDYLRFGINLLVHNYKDSDIRNMMEREMAIKVVNSNFSLDILRSMAKLTPALGLTGTVISLIKMFNHFNTIDEILPLMAVALMSTFYGVVIANVLILPLYSKIKGKSIVSETLMNIAIEGIMAISSRENPKVIEDRLKGYEDYASKERSSSTAPPARQRYSPPAMRTIPRSHAVVGTTTSKYV